MWQIATITAQLNILPGIRARIKDSVAAVEQALETAIWATPAYRERVLRYQQQRRSDYSEEFRFETTLPAERGEVRRVGAIILGHMSQNRNSGMV